MTSIKAAANQRRKPEMETGIEDSVVEDPVPVCRLPAVISGDSPAEFEYRKGSMSECPLLTVRAPGGGRREPIVTDIAVIFNQRKNRAHLRSIKGG